MDSTREKIIEAAIVLITEKGYKAATTKAIAEKAGVNEVTIFRHFGSKKGILESAVSQFSYAPALARLIEQEMTGELEADLLTISRNYHDFMKDIKEYVLIGFREEALFPELADEVAKIPKALKGELINFLVLMKEQGKIADDLDIEAQVMNFIWLNFGYFLSTARLGNKVTEMKEETFLRNSVRLFARGLKP